MQEPIIITTDGASSGQRGCGWAWLNHETGELGQGWLPMGTNQYAELMAVYDALTYINAMHQRVILRLDSQFIIGILYLPGAAQEPGPQGIAVDGPALGRPGPAGDALSESKITRRRPLSRSS